MTNIIAVEASIHLVSLTLAFSVAGPLPRALFVTLLGKSVTSRPEQLALTGESVDDIKQHAAWMTLHSLFITASDVI